MARSHENRKLRRRRFRREVERAWDREARWYIQSLRNASQAASVEVFVNGQYLGTAASGFTIEHQ